MAKANSPGKCTGKQGLVLQSNNSKKSHSLNMALASADGLNIGVVYYIEDRTSVAEGLC